MPEALAAPLARAGARPRVTLASLGRFHALDLARQLHRRGMLAALYTGYPTGRLRSERLPRELIRSFPWVHGPFMLRGRLGTLPAVVDRTLELLDRVSFDRFVAATLPDCDVFWSLSGMALTSGDAAVRRGTPFVCDRGSAHIRAQAALLEAEHDRVNLKFHGVDARLIEWEEREYALCARLVVPSTFAWRSFVERGVPPGKLRVVPYGVDLERFYPAARPASGEFRVLFVGALSVQKGVHDLLDAFDRVEHPNKRLVLVGSVSPEARVLLARRASLERVTITGPVDQAAVREHMSRAHAFVLASVHDGFGLVLAQAMACGCPVIATEHTGGPDLITEGVDGFVVPPRDPAAIAARLQVLADDADRRDAMGAAALDSVSGVGGWDAYGERMAALFADVAGARVTA